MSRRVKRKVISNDISSDCQMLESDFFAMAEGKVSEVKIIDVRDLIEPDGSVVKDSLGKVFSRCEKVWFDYCGLLGLPRESHFMFRKRIRRKWESMGGKEGDIPT